MSKISDANRMGKGNVKNLRQSRLNQARSTLGIIPKPTTPKAAPAVKRPAAKAAPKRRPPNISDVAWKRLQKQ